MPTRPLPPRNAATRRAKLLAGTAASLAILSGPIQAATFTWDGQANPDRFWSTATNWNADGVPGSNVPPSTGANDVATFSSNAANVFGAVNLNATTFTLDIVNFTNNTTSAYTLSNGGLIINQINQTGSQGNTVQVPITATNALTSNVTQSTLQLQSQVTTGAGGLIKNGGQTLRLGTSGTNFENLINGPIFLNSGSLTASAAGTAGSNNPLGGTGVGSTEIIVGGTGTILNLQSQMPLVTDVYDFQRNVQFGNFGGTINVQPSTADPGDPTNRVGNLTIGDATLTIGTASGYKFAADSLNITGTATTFAVNATSTIDGLSGGAGSVLTKTGGSTLTINGDNSATYLGSTILLGGTTVASQIGGIGSGAVTVGTLSTTAQGFLNQTAQLNIAAGSASAQTITAEAGSQINLLGVPGAESFVVRSGAVIQGSPTELSALNTATNLQITNGAVIAVESDPSPITPLGNFPQGLAEKSVFLGLAANVNTTGFAIGTGTPLIGISNDRASRVLNGTDVATPAVITVNGGDNDVATVEATLQGLNGATLTLGTVAAGDAFVQFANAGPKATLAIQGIGGTNFLGSPGGNVQIYDDATASGLAAAFDKVIIQSGALSLGANNALGGVPLEVRSGGALDLQTTALSAIDGPVNVLSGGILDVPGSLSGTGAITVQGGGVVDVAAVDAFSSLVQPVTLVGTGHTIRLRVDNVTDLDAKVADDATFIVAGANRSQTAGISLNENGLLTNDGATRTFTGTITSTGTALRFAATNNTDLFLASNLDATGKPVNIGVNGVVDYQLKNTTATGTNGANVNGQTSDVIFSGTFRAGSVNVVPGLTAGTAAGTVAFDNADVNISGDLNVGSGVAYLAGGGPINGGLRGELTPRLTSTTGLVADRLADNVVIGTNGRVEMGVQITTSTGARLDVTQPFVIAPGADINAGDKRSIWVDKAATSAPYTAGTDTGVNLSNVTLGANSVFAIDESGTDVRVALNLAGSAAVTFGQDAFDLLSVTNVTANPVTLTVGRASEAIATYGVFGAIGAGVQIDMVKGSMNFNTGSSILPTTVINNTVNASNFAQTLNLVNDPGDGTVNIGGNGSLELRNGVTGTAGNTNYAGLTVNANTSGGVVGFVNEVATAPALVNQINTPINFTGVANALAAERNNDLAVTGSVTFDTVNTTGNLDLHGRNGTGLNIGTLNVTGAAALTNNSVGSIGTIAAGSNALTVTGGSRTRVTGNLTSGALAVSGAPTAGLEFSPGVGGTSVVTVPSVQVNSLLAARTGTTDFGSTVLASVPTGTFVAGLQEGRVTNTTDLPLGAITPTSFGIQLQPRTAQTTNKAFNPATGWSDNETWVYTGEIFDADGTFSFIENIDDDIQIKINGVEVLLNKDVVAGFSSASTTTNSAVANGLQGSGAVVPGANQSPGATSNFGASPGGNGWYPIEIRMQNGGGGAGPTLSNGFNNYFGVGFSSAGSTALSNDPAFVKPVDNGTMNLFRTTTVTSGNLAVDGGAELSAGGFTGIGTVTMAGSGNAILELNGTGAAIVSDAGTIAVTGTASGMLDVARSIDTVTFQSMNIGATASFLKDGAGALLVQGLAAAGNIGALTVGEGSLGGNGTLLGPVTVNAAAVLAPGNGLGILGTGNLNLLADSIFRLEIGGTSAGTGYDQVNVTGTISLAGALQGSLFGGFTPQLNDTFFVMLNDGSDAVTGGFAGFAEGSTVNVGGAPFTLTYLGNGDGGVTGNDVALISQVPEPTSMLALLSGVGMLAGLQRFRRTARQR